MEVEKEEMRAWEQVPSLGRSVEKAERIRMSLNPIRKNEEEEIFEENQHKFHRIVRKGKLSDKKYA